MRLATPIAILVLLAALAGCGSSEETTETGPTGRPTETRPELRAAFLRDPGCRRPPGASRWACSVGAFRCQGVVTDRGYSISCSKPGRSVAFTVRP
ncbi:MAG TPA: hypothetical protein VFU11_00740 [Solirubrobacterales bacterium]|nr:hypothetical protein [Solirubrobacterales bacterium]